MVHEEPGTTRDAVDTVVRVEGRPYVLVDTAGLRRKGRTEGALDKLSASSTAEPGTGRSGARRPRRRGRGHHAGRRIAGYAEAAGRAVILVANSGIGRVADRARNRPHAPRAPPVPGRRSHCLHVGEEGTGLRTVRDRRPRRARLRQGDLDRRAESSSRPPWSVVRPEGSTARRSRSSTGPRSGPDRQHSSCSSMTPPRFTSPTSGIWWRARRLRLTGCPVRSVSAGAARRAPSQVVRPELALALGLVLARRARRRGAVGPPDGVEHTTWMSPFERGTPAGRSARPSGGADAPDWGARS